MSWNIPSFHPEALLEHFRIFMKEQVRKIEPVTPDRPLLLAVSGGLDSMALLHLTFQLTIPFQVLHVNFSLRDEESDQDEFFVRNTCEALQVPLLVKKFDTISESKKLKKGIQETARILRYEWMLSLIYQNKAAALLTAHHADDHVETAVMHFFRGAGLNGLQGIATWNNGILRPLLSYTKQELKDYLLFHKGSWREDSSNLTDKYTRNFFRHRVWPAIEEIFPTAKNNIRQHLTYYHESNLLVQESTDRLFRRYAKPVADSAAHDEEQPEFKFPCTPLKKHPAVGTVLYEWLQKYGFRSSQIKDLVHLLDAQSGKWIAAADGMFRIYRFGKWVYVLRHAPETPSVLHFLEEEELKKGRPIQVGQLIFQWKKAESTGSLLEQAQKASPHEVYLNGEAIQFPIVIRSAQSGDYLYPLGLGKKKKVARLLIDEKVPSFKKASIPLIEIGKKIAWVSGVRMDQRFAIQPKSKLALYIKMLD